MPLSYMSSLLSNFLRNWMEIEGFLLFFCNPCFLFFFFCCHLTLLHILSIRFVLFQIDFSFRAEIDKTRMRIHTVMKRKRERFCTFFFALRKSFFYYHTFSYTEKKQSLNHKRRKCGGKRKESCFFLWSGGVIAAFRIKIRPRFIISSSFFNRYNSW